MALSHGLQPMRPLGQAWHPPSVSPSAPLLWVLKHFLRHAGKYYFHLLMKMSLRSLRPSSLPRLYTLVKKCRGVGDDTPAGSSLLFFLRFLTGYDAVPGQPWVGAPARLCEASALTHPSGPWFCQPFGDGNPGQHGDIPLRTGAS